MLATEDVREAHVVSSAKKCALLEPTQHAAHRPGARELVQHVFERPVQLIEAQRARRSVRAAGERGTHGHRGGAPDRAGPTEHMMVFIPGGIRVEFIAPAG